MGLWKSFNKNKVYIFSGILLFFFIIIPSVDWFNSIFGEYFHFIIIGVVVIYVINEVNQKRKSDSSAKEFHIDEKKHHEESEISFQDTRTIKETVQKIDKEIERDQHKREENYEKNSLLIYLINEQLIPISVIDETIPDKKFITVFCTSEGFSNNIPKHISDLKKPDREKYNQFRPDHAKIFEKINFVQLTGRPNYFIIAEDNLYPEKLRNISNLADYLIKKSKLLLDEKWNDIMEEAETNSPVFFRNRQDKDNPLNFNTLIIKSNSRDMRHRFQIKNDFKPEFTTELTSLSNMKKLKNKIKDNEKIEIKKFVLNSSIKILILKADKTDQEKILEVEPIFRSKEEEGGLGIKHFYDYHKREKADISNILRKKFSDEEKVSKYTDMIIKNSKQYKEDLITLGIDLSD